MALLSDGEKKIEDMFIRFDTMHERDGHTHTYTQTCTLQTDRHRMTATGR